MPPSLTLVNGCIQRRKSAGRGVDVDPKVRAISMIWICCFNAVQNLHTRDAIAFHDWDYESESRREARNHQVLEGAQCEV